MEDRTVFCVSMIFGVTVTALAWANVAIVRLILKAQLAKRPEELDGVVPQEPEDDKPEGVAPESIRAFLDK